MVEICDIQIALTMLSNMNITHMEPEAVVVAMEIYKLVSVLQ